MSSIQINDPTGSEFLLKSLMNGSEHKKILIYPSIYVSEKDIQVLVSLKTYDAIYKAYEPLMEPKTDGAGE